MSQQVVTDPAIGTVDVMTIALRTGSPFPLDGPLLEDPESRRGHGLLAESHLAAEREARLHRDRDRLFLGDARRGPIAPMAVPPAAAESFERLREEMVAACVCRPGPATDLVDALGMLAALGPALPGEPATFRSWRRRLVTEHLLTWGAGCLSRMQLGAQTFFYQGVAALGLGLLRHLSEQLSRTSPAG